MFIFIALFIVLAGIMFVSAAKPADDNATSEDTQGAEVKNMTYGSCVSEATKVRNTCYSGVKAFRKTCLDDAKNQTDSAVAKTIAKTCKTTYKKDMKTCKTDFKAAKKQECAKIKHNFLETIGSSFK